MAVIDIEDEQAMPAILEVIANAWHCDVKISPRGAL
jgi:hypothetical protein